MAESQKPEREMIERKMADPQTGLTSVDVQIRTDKGWTNAATPPPSKTIKEIIKSNVLTYFNLIFVILAILLVVAGSIRNLTFLPVIIGNTLIGIIQEVRAKKVLDEMTMLNAPKARVLREGAESVINAEALVIDDLVRFKAGNQIPADGVVVEGEVRVNESLLTGEADEIVKKPGDALLSGSFIVSGEVLARLTAVGDDAYISGLTLKAKSMQEGEQSEMIRSLDKLVRGVGIAIVPIGIILFYQAYSVQGAGFSKSITGMVAAVLGMIPEGLYLLTSVALAVSSIKLAQKKVLLHDMKCIETLARVDVLCADKTGTITDNTMTVKGFKAEGAMTKDEMEVLLGDFAKAQASDNVTMETLKAAFKKTSERKVTHKTGFNSVSKYSSVTFEDIGTIVLGAPEMILPKTCGDFEETIQNATGKGLRVLGLVKTDAPLDGKPVSKDGEIVGFVFLANKIRPEAPDTFRYFAGQGVDIKVISGDNPLTVSRVASEAGIRGAENFVDARTLDSDTKISEALRTHTVFGRVTPDKKRDMVRLLKQDGHTVAMTGDGVNDVLALKDADCSIAMASGSDAACQAAQIVLLESDFSKMPEVVLEGRQVVNNIERSASLFLVKNIFSFLMAIFSLLFVIKYPLEPSQISLISAFTIGVPGFFLAMEPNPRRIEGRFLTNVFLKALPAGLTDLFAVGALVLFGIVFNVSPEDISTAATMLLAIVGFMILYDISKPMNALRISVFALCLGGLIACSFLFNNWFSLHSMSKQSLMLFVVFSIATEPVLIHLQQLVAFVTKSVRNIKKKFGRKNHD